MRLARRPYIFKKRRNAALFSIADTAGFGVKALMPRKEIPPDEDVRSILVIRLAHIGDVLFTTPAIRAVKRRFPSATVTALIGSYCRELLAGNPYVDDIITWDAPWHDRSKPAQKGRPGRGLRDVITLLRQRQFDIAVQFGLDYHDNLVCALSGSSLTLGYDVAGLGFLLSRNPEFSPVPLHDIDHNLRLVSALGTSSSEGAMDLFPDVSDRESMDRLIEDKGWGAFALLHPGAGNRDRMWTSESFARVAEQLSSEHSLTPVICGGPADVADARQIAARARVDTEVVAGKTSLMQTAALISRSAVCVGLESSFVHFGAALRIPTVAIFSGFTDTERWAVNNRTTITLKHDLPCRAGCDTASCDHRECITGIPPEEVMLAVRVLLERNGFKRTADSRVDDAPHQCGMVIDA